MITIHLSTEDLTKVRLAPSPLWETVTSFGVLLQPDRHTMHAPWVTHARRVLPGTDLFPLLAAMCIELSYPDFLSPPPDTSAATFDEELECLRATPPEVVHTEVQLLVQAQREQFSPLSPEKTRLLETYLSNPESSLMRLVDTLRRYHDLTIAPYWPRIRELLEGDTIKRGQVLALGGVEALLSNLHPKAGYCGGVLELDKTCEALIEPAGRGIALVPCVFAWPGIMVLTDPGYRPTLAYGPRGVANLWSSSSSAPNGTAIEAALGAGRASVLKSLSHADHHDRAGQPTPPELLCGLSPPPAAKGRRANRAAPQRQESLLPTQLRWRVAARDFRRTGVDFRSVYPAHLCLI